VTGPGPALVGSAARWVRRAGGISNHVNVNCKTNCSGAPTGLPSRTDCSGAHTRTDCSGAHTRPGPLAQTVLGPTPGLARSHRLFNCTQTSTVFPTFPPTFPLVAGCGVGKASFGSEAERRWPSRLEEVRGSGGLWGAGRPRSTLLGAPFVERKNRDGAAKAMIPQPARSADRSKHPPAAGAGGAPNPFGGAAAGSAPAFGFGEQPGRSGCCACAHAATGPTAPLIHDVGAGA
jgi:hypothetical protein